MPRTFILVRHAQSEHHVRGLTGGWTDTPLTELGHRQAQRVAERLGRELNGVPVALYASDLARTRETADHIARRLGLLPTFDERLREWNNGEAAGLSWEEANTRWPQPSRWTADLRHWPGSETWREFQSRAASFVASLPASEATALIVTHGGTIEALVSAWLGFTADAMEDVGFRSDVTGITVLAERGGSSPYRSLERTNDTSHLEGIEGSTALLRRPD